MNLLEELLSLVENESADLNQKQKEIILRDCGPFIEEIGGIENVIDYPLYRGGSFKNAEQIDNDVFIGKIRSDRRPKSMPIRLHNKINALFIQKFGFAFRNGAFVTGHSIDAGHYGNVSVCVPIGEFHYCWSTVVRDLYSYLQLYSRKTFNAGINVYDGSNNDDLLDSVFDYFEKELFPTYRVNNLIAGIKSGNELMIMGNTYYLMRELG